MTKSEIPVMPQFFDRYINQVDNIFLMDALLAVPTFDAYFPPQTLEAIGDLRYAPGKWMVKDILQHVIDTERIMAYRAMRFARADKTPLPSFDENLFANLAHATRRTIPELYAEFAAVRQSTILMFGSFDNEMLLRTGVASQQTISVLALGFVLVGHARHHATIIKERYLPLLS